MPPPSSRAAVQVWQRHADQIRAFLSECTVSLPPTARPMDGTPAKDLCRAYATWASQTGHRAMSSTSLGMRLGLLGIHKRHTERGKLYDLELVANADERGPE